VALDQEFARAAEGSKPCRLMQVSVLVSWALQESARAAGAALVLPRMNAKAASLAG